MKYSLILLLSFQSMLSFAQKNIDIEKYFKKVDAEQASIGISIKSLSGNTVLAYNAKKSLVPASTLKIVTTATALELYGSAYKIPTIVGVDRRDSHHLIIQGYGDPTLGSAFVDVQPSAFFDTWISQISKKIDRSKPIKLTVVDDYFGYDGISPKWPYEDLGNYYAAGAYGISLFDNTYKLYLSSMQADKCPAIVKTEPLMKGMIFENNLRLNGTGTDNASINGLPFSNNRTLRGTIPAKRPSFVIKGDVPNPGLLLAQTLAKRLEEAGYKVAKLETTRQKYLVDRCNNSNYTVLDIDPIYTTRSPALKDIIRVVNVRSNNHYAEHLIRSVGRFQNKGLFVDALSAGIDKTKSYWKAKGVPTQSMIMSDGSGLAPSNGISADALSEILLYMKTKSSYSADYLSSFPQAGKEGTVRNFLKGTRLEGKVSVKSGSIANVQCFAGYYINGSKVYTFAVMVNNYNSPRKDIMKAIELLLLDYLN